MDVMGWSLVLGSIAAVWLLAVWANRRSIRECDDLVERDDSGDAQGDVVIFTEAIRWLFIIWGFTHFRRGLRRVGCRHQVRLFRWSSVPGALAVIPDLVRRRWLLSHAERLSRWIEQIAAKNPGRTIHLVGYSTGCYLTLEACKRIGCCDAIGQVILLAGSVSPRYPLHELSGRLRVIHSFHSGVDLITGIGPLLFGGNDRRYSVACGTVGFADAPPFVTQRAWRLEDARLGYFGDHFTIASSRFVAEHVAPILDSQDRPQLT